MSPPRARGHPADGPLPGWLTAQPFAHRGLHDGARPENSLAAVEAAADAGLGIELDVRLTRDGVPVVVHDDDLRRVTGRGGRVATSSARMLGARTLLGSGESIPTLAAALGAVAGRVPVMLELKHTGVRVGPLEAAVTDALGGYGGSVCAVSFHPLSLWWLARRAPRLLRGQVAGPDHPRGLPAPLRASLARLWWDPLTRPHFVSFALDALPTPVTTRWRRRGRVLVAWTARTHDELEAADRLADTAVLEGAAARQAVRRRARP